MPDSNNGPKDPFAKWIQDLNSIERDMDESRKPRFG